MREAKVASVASFIPDQQVDSGTDAGLAVVAWGSTYGTIYQAVRECVAEGLAVGHIHLRHLNPLPPNLPTLLAQFDRILVPELNNGQLATLLRDKLVLPVEQHNQVNGQPFAVADVKQAIARYAPKRIKEAG